MRVAIFTTLLCALVEVAAAADYRAGPDDYRERLPHLRAGDRLFLQPGDYMRGLPLHHVSGAPGAPVTVEAADPADPPRFLARRGAHTVSLVDVRHVVLRNLELDGRDAPVDAVRAEGRSRYADFVTLEGLHIHDHAASQQNVGISTKCPAFGWIVRRNRIERVGTGMYFGDSDGSDPFVAGLVEGNTIAATRGYNLQIKHQTHRPIEYAGRHDTVVRHNVFSKRDALPGPQARPNVLLGHFPPAGPGSDDRYLVYGNVFLDNPSEALLQAEGRVVVYDNVFVNAAGDAIRIQPHNDVPRDIAIFSNSVLASGVGIRVRRDDAASYRQRVVGNLVAASIPIDGGEATHNVTLAYRAEWFDVAPAGLSSTLLAAARWDARLPPEVEQAFAGYPDWHPPRAPGAQLPLVLPAAAEGRRP